MSTTVYLCVLFMLHAGRNEKNHQGTSMIGNLRMRLTCACSSLALPQRGRSDGHSEPVRSGGNPVKNAGQGWPYVMPRSEVRRMRSDAGVTISSTSPAAERRRLEGIPSLSARRKRRASRLRRNTRIDWGATQALAPGIVVGIGYPDASRRTFD